MLDIISAIRKVCELENGFENLFKDSKLTELRKYTNDNKSLNLLSKLLFGNARENLIELINDVYHYEEILDLIITDLEMDDLSTDEANEAIDIFLKTFGFPGYRKYILNPITKFVSYDKNNFKSIYEGETKNSKEYGIGTRYNYYEGESCGWDECVWINGKMFGYCHSLDIEFGSYKTKKYGFVVNDTYVGNYMNVYEDGEEGYMHGVKLNLE